MSYADRCLTDPSINADLAFAESTPAICPISMTYWWRSFVIEYDSQYISNRTMLSLRQPKVEIMPSGHFVSRASDYIIYSVEAKNIDAVVKTFGPCMLTACISLPVHLLTPVSYKAWSYRRWPDFM